MKKFLFSFLIILNLNCLSCDLDIVKQSIEKIIRNHSYSEDYNKSKYTRLEKVNVHTSTRIRAAISSNILEGSLDLSEINFHESGVSYWAYTYFYLDNKTCTVNKDKHEYPIKVVNNETGKVWIYKN